MTRALRASQPPRPSGGPALFFLALALAAGALFLPEPALGPELHVLTAPAAAGPLEVLCTAHLGGERRYVLEFLRGSWAGRLRRDPVPDLVAGPRGALVRLRRQGLVAAPFLELARPRLHLLVRREVAAPPASPEELLRPGVGRIAVADPETPGGAVTRRVLKELGLWFLLLPRLHPYPSPAAALQALRRGQVEAALLVTLPPRPAGTERVTYTFPEELAPAETYCLAPTKRGPRREKARAFLRFLATPAGQKLRAAAAAGLIPQPRPPLTRRLRPLLLSLRVACVAVMLLFPILLFLGALLGGGSLRFWRRLGVGLCLFPLLLPPPALGLAALAVLGAGGPLARLTGLRLDFTWQGGALASAVAALPCALVPLLVALRRTRGEAYALAQAARLGAAGRYLLVHLPLAGRGLLAGLLLAFARAAGEFGATLVVAGAVPEWTEGIATGLYRALLHGDAEGAQWLAWAGAALAAAAGGAALWAWRERPKA